MVVNSALDYLKGKDLSPERFSYTAWFFGPTPEEWVAQLTARKEEPLVQIAPLTFPDKPCAPVDVAVFDDTHSEEYPEWSVQNLTRRAYGDDL